MIERIDKTQTADVQLGRQELVRGVRDVETNTLTVNVDIVLKFKENIQIDCDKHILLSSGQKIDPESDNETPYAIWLNPEKDDDGNPITKLEMPIEDG